MKKLAFLTLFLLAVGATSLQAQGKGIRAGWQRSSIFNDGDKLGDPANSFYVGFFRNQELAGDFLKLNTGIDYMSTGWKNDDENFHKIHYISVTAGVRGYLGPVFAQVGLNTNMRVGQKIEINGEDARTEENKAKFFDVPVHAGLGVQLAMVTLEARYHYSLYDLNDEGDRNAYIQFGAGFSF